MVRAASDQTPSRPCPPNSFRLPAGLCHRGPPRLSPVDRAKHVRVGKAWMESELRRLLPSLPMGFVGCVGMILLLVCIFQRKLRYSRIYFLGESVYFLAYSSLFRPPIFFLAQLALHEHFIEGHRSSPSILIFMAVSVGFRSLFFDLSILLLPL